MCIFRLNDFQENGLNSQSDQWFGQALNESLGTNGYEYNNIKCVFAGRLYNPFYCSNSSCPGWRWAVRIHNIVSYFIYLVLRFC